MLVTHIGNIKLTNPLWWTNFNDTKTIDGEAVGTIDGGTLIFEKQMLDTSINIDLASVKNSGWQDNTTKNAIISLAQVVNSYTTITLKDSNVINVRFRNEDMPYKFTHVKGTYECDYFTAEIKLAKV